MIKMYKYVFTLKTRFLLSLETRPILIDIDLSESALFYSKFSTLTSTDRQDYDDEVLYVCHLSSSVVMFLSLCFRHSATGRRDVDEFDPAPETPYQPGIEPQPRRRSRCVIS